MRRTLSLQNKEENENPSDVWEKPVAKSFVEHMK